MSEPCYVLDEEQTEREKQRYEGYFQHKGFLKHEITELIWMHPVAYLRMIGWTIYIEKYRLGTWYFGEEQPASIVEALKNGVKLPTTVFFMGEDGRRYADGKNRAYWSWKLGVNEIPVIMNKEAIDLAKKEDEKEKKWEDIIQKIINISGDHKYIYQPVEHPYFDDWEVTQICSDRLQTMVEYVGNVSGKRILDVGCFFGWFCHKLAKLGAKAVGVELDPKKVEIAKALSACYGLPPTNPEFISGRYQDFLEEGNHYDIILYLSNFHHELREDIESAWRSINLISKQTNLMFFDMDEYHTTENLRNKGLSWKPELILDHTEFTKLTPLRPSNKHNRILYAFEKGGK